MTIRVQANDGSWLPFACSIVERSPTGLTEIRVPELRGNWLIGDNGMIANVGGNDWRIYTLHVDDCKSLCESKVGAP